MQFVDAVPIQTVRNKVDFRAERNTMVLLGKYPTL